ncbi:hypothetical protein [Roseospira marina]|uniref:hypothetical protein n=1 Tax=Roseospira marina TaxID=140057 RepID=UPI0014788075|nr:hypothetical protein [Roseospira marina]MBB4315393.1 hypothetical protein [Roseospira marina]MBB5088462.1 hypothetical protein [Roseospira marina]
MSRQQVTVTPAIHQILKRMAAFENLKMNDLLWRMIQQRLATYQPHTRQSVMEGVKTK